MHKRVLAVVSIFCLGLPLLASAELHTPLSDNASSHSFDEIDEQTLKAEVSKQALAFLRTVESHWGTNQSALRATLPGQIRDDEHGKLIYLHNLSDHGVLEGYEFKQESLVRGQYILLQRPLNGLNEFIGYYETLKQVLSDSYGTPRQDRITWSNDLYQPLPDYWGVAVMIGHLQYHAEWTTADGTITLDLTGDHHSKLSLEYGSSRASAQA
ncbi:MAG TPA: hypothetical protein VIR79_04140 [Nitrospira sp.]